jgi:PASTA domain
MPPLAPKPATSVGQVFALVAGFLALAAIGAAIGWTVTDTSGITAAASVTQSPSASPTASASPTPSPSPSVTYSGLVVPDFAKNGTSFIDARKQLMNEKIQGLPVFLGGSGDNTVVRTSPAGGQPMSKGKTVKLYVNETPPQLDVPNVVHEQCKAAGSDVASVGFVTAYAGSVRTGVVLSQDPDSTDQTAHWLDTVTLTCGSPTSAPPSTTPSSPDDSGAPSDGASN